MIRRTLRLLAAALVASFALVSFAEAAPPKTIRHRTRHPRGSSYRTSTAPRLGTKKTTPKKKTAKKKAAGSTTTAPQSSTATSATPRASTPVKPARKPTKPR